MGIFPDIRVLLPAYECNLRIQHSVLWFWLRKPYEVSGLACTHNPFSNAWFNSTFLMKNRSFDHSRVQSDFRSVGKIATLQHTNFPKGRAYLYWIEPQKTFCGNKWADGQSWQERSSPVVCFSPARPDAAAGDKSFKIWIIHFPISDLSHSSPSGHTNLVLSLQSHRTLGWSLFGASATSDVLNID